MSEIAIYNSSNSLISQLQLADDSIACFVVDYIAFKPIIIGHMVCTFSEIKKKSSNDWANIVVDSFVQVACNAATQCFRYSLELGSDLDVDRQKIENFAFSIFKESTLNFV